MKEDYGALKFLNMILPVTVGEGEAEKEVT